MAAVNRSYHAGTSYTSAAQGLNVPPCLDVASEYLVMEMVRYYATGQDTVAAVHAVETIGFRIGSLLAERCGHNAINRPRGTAARCTSRVRHQLNYAHLCNCRCAATWRTCVSPAASASPAAELQVPTQRLRKLVGLHDIERQCVLCVAVSAKHACRLTAGQERIDDPLIKFKFLCTQFWTALFGRKVDGLKTNRRVRRCDLTGLAAPQACTEEFLAARLPSMSRLQRARQQLGHVAKSACELGHRALVTVR